MKKLLYILLLFSNSLNAQIEANISTQTQSWVSNCSNRPSVRAISAVNTTINREMIDGNWSLESRFFIFGLDQSSSALQSIVNPTYNATTENSPTFTDYVGFTGNGTNSYINTNWNPSTDANFTLNSGAITIYRASSSDEKGIHGCYDGTNATQLWFYEGSGNTHPSTQINSTSGIVASSIYSSGVYTGIRTSSSALILYYNNSSIVSGSESSSAIPDYIQYVLARNSSGTASNFATTQVSAYVSSSGAINVTGLYNTLTYLSAILQW